MHFVCDVCNIHTHFKIYCPWFVLVLPIELFAIAKQNGLQATFNVSKKKQPGNLLLKSKPKSQMIVKKKANAKCERAHTLWKQRIKKRMLWCTCLSYDTIFPIHYVRKQMCSIRVKWISRQGYSYFAKVNLLIGKYIHFLPRRLHCILFFFFWYTFILFWLEQKNYSRKIM